MSVFSDFTRRKLQRWTLKIFTDLIDLAFYNKVSGFVFPTGKQALTHYLAEGAERSLAPNAYFDAQWYGKTYQRAGNAASLFKDYVLIGVPAGWQPSPRFDSTWYLKRYSDISINLTSPLAHFLKYGRAEGRFPTADMERVMLSGLFDIDFYNRQFSHPFETAIEALQHYFDAGVSEGKNPSEGFDTAWYCETYPDTMELGRNPLLDFINRRPDYDRNPSRVFDCSWYLSKYPDITKAGVNPLLHYIKKGRDEGRFPYENIWNIMDSGLFDISFYNLQVSRSFKRPEEAIQHYFDEGADSGLNPNEFFDTKWYFQTYSDVRKLGRNPLLDFLSRKPRYDRNPSDAFDCTWYLSQYPDVFEGNVNPLYHYLSSGRKEHRLASRMVAKRFVHTPFVDIFADLGPTDSELRFEGAFFAEAIPEEKRNYTSFSAAGKIAKIDGPFSDRRDIFPPRPYFAAFKNIGVIGGSRLLIRDNHTLFSDEIVAFQESSQWAVRPYRINMGEGGQVRFPVIRRYPDTIDSGIHLMHDYGKNYYHMVSEILPRMLIAEEAQIRGDIPFLIQDGLHPNLLKLIDLVNIEKRDLVVLKDDHLYRVKELIYLSDISGIQDVYVGKRHPENTCLHTEAISTVLDRILRQVVKSPSESHPSRRLYVRRGGRYRGLLNESDIEEILVARGFELVSMEGLSLKAQILLFNQASVIIAPTGAALTNITWCQPHTKVGVLAGLHDAMPTDIWEQLGKTSKCSISVLKCPQVPGDNDKYSLHNNCKVNIDKFLEWLEEFS